MNSRYTLSAIIQTTGNSRVEAWDAAGLCTDLIDVALTDTSGAFEMQLDADYLAQLLPQKAPVLAFRIFDAGKLVPQAKDITWTVTQKLTQLTIPLGTAPATTATTATAAAVTPAQSVVRGTVSHGDGSPAASQTVRAFDRNLTATAFADTQLGTATTAADGTYEIHYAMPAGGKLKPDLIVTVDAAATTPPAATATVAAPAVTSPLISDAPTVAFVDLSLDGIVVASPSEFASLGANVAPILARNKIAIAAVVPAQYDYVAGAAAIDSDRLDSLVQAAQLSAGPGAGVDPEIFYGLLQQGFAGGLSDLAQQPADAQRPRLQAALDGNVIASTYEPKLDALVASLVTAVVAQTFPTTGATAASTALRNTLTATVDQQKAFVSAWSARTGSASQFWTDLRADATLGKVADDLETTLRFDLMCGGFAPALAELRKRRQAGTVKSLRDLARWQDSDWQSFVAIVGAPTTAPGDTPAAKAAAYATALAAIARAAYPTEYLRGAAAITPAPIGFKYVPTLEAANPTLDLKSPLPDTPNWGIIAAADQAAARTEWNAFAAEARTFRRAPSPMLLSAVISTGGTNPVRTAASHVLLGATSLDLEHTTVDQYLAANPTALNTVSAGMQPAVVAYLKGLQRLIRIVPKPEAIATLLADGVDSSLRVVAFSPDDFVDAYGTTLGGTTAARTTYASALRMGATAQVTLSTACQAIAGAAPLAIRGGSTTQYPPPDYAGVLTQIISNATGASAGSAPPATWPKLFQGEAWCSCDDCSSAYSPAAYFVDLLHTMLDAKYPASTPASQLFDRRPDLPNLILSCDNTNVPLPYIDLVNEILELHIAQNHKLTDPNNNNAPYSESTSYDSTGLTAEVLRAVPQNVIAGVYDQVLAVADHPFTLPFSRGLAVVRTYLDQLGTSYADLLRAFPPVAPDGDVTTPERIEAESLQLTRRQFELISGLATFTPTFYGYATTDTTWQTELVDVPTLLNRTGVLYGDLVGLVTTYFVNAPMFNGAAIYPKLQPPSQCQIEGTNLLNPTLDMWDRLHRFVRLWRACGWSIADLDRALFAVGGHAADKSITLTDDTVRKIGLVTDTIAALGQPLSAVISLWAPLDTWGSDARYLTLFQNQTVARLDDQTWFQLNTSIVPDPQTNPVPKPTGGVGELLTTTQMVGAHVPTILAALNISAIDLDSIRAHAVSTQALPSSCDSLNDTPLNLNNLTIFYRYTVLATGLGMRISDLIALLELTNAAPFTAGDPQPTLDFIAIARTVQASAFTPAALAYLFFDESSDAQGPTPSTSVILAAMSQVWSVLRVVRQDTAVTDDPDGTLLATRLALLFSPDIVATILDALDPSKWPAISPTDPRRVQALTYLKPYLDGHDQDPVAQPDPPSSDPASQEQRERDNQALVLSYLSLWLFQSLGTSAVISAVASSLALSTDLASRLLMDWIPGMLAELLLLEGGGLQLTSYSAAAYGGIATVDTAPATLDLQVTVAGAVHSAKWTGNLLALGTGDHAFTIRTDGAATVTIANQTQTVTIVNDSSGNPVVHDTVLTVKALVANQLVPIAVAYDAGTAAGSFDVLWQLSPSPSANAPTAIPPEYLFPTTLTTFYDPKLGGPGSWWRLAHKAALLINGFGLSAEEIDYMQLALVSAPSPTGPFGTLQLQSLPTTLQPVGSPTAQAQMAAWIQLAEYVALRNSLPSSDPSLIDQLTLLEQAPPAGAADYANALCAATGWDPTVVLTLFAPWPNPMPSGQPAAVTLASLLASVAGAVTTGGPYELGRRLTALATCLDLIKRTGVDAATLNQWVANEPTTAIANQVVQAVRAAYPDDTQWLQVAQTRNDTLRQLQRDALVAQIMVHLKINKLPPQDVNSLFEYFLIDVEMCACGISSRVLQAISAVQLFIQRIQLGLEPPIKSSSIDPDKWEWNEQYRIWQANREIFLYPENWIDPELRVDETPFFSDLQSQLSQGPLDSDNVEAAFEAYLESLQEVSRLQACAIHWEREGNAANEQLTSPIAENKVIDTLHVVARTPGAHPTYYYRTLLGTAIGGGGTEWTPWQKISVDIDGDGDTGDVHMLLTTFDRRLYLFWATFTERPEPGQPGGNEGQSPGPSLTHWEIRLAWSTLRDGAWSAKQVTPSALRSDRFISIGTTGYKDAIKDAAKLLNDSHKHAKTLHNEVTTAEKALLHDLNSVWGRAVDLGFTFPHMGQLPDTLPRLESHLKKRGQSITQLITALAKLVPIDPLLNPLEPFTAKALGDEYAALQSLRQQYSAAQADHEQLYKSWSAFKAGTSPLAIPSFTTRGDHTFWLDTSDDGVAIRVMRHDDRTWPKELGIFTLSADGRSVSLETETKTVRFDLSGQTPRHSTPDINAFEIDTSSNKGLDLEGMSNLLGRVHQATFTDEHWFHHPVTSDSPRPFTIGKGSELHIALPDAEQKSKSSVLYFPPLASKSTATPLVAANVPTVVSNVTPASPAGPIESVVADLAVTQKSFGLDQIVANPQLTSTKLYVFEPLHHPFVKSFIKRLERDGVDGLLTLAAQTPSNADDGGKGQHFDQNFKPKPALVTTPYSPYDVDFRTNGPYALYNWELFFHAPYLIAARLMTDGQYEQARDWLHYIFDPTTSSKDTTVARYWQFEPFYTNTDLLNIDQLMSALAVGQPTDVVNDVKAQIDQWYRYPADPHRIARLRISAYQKAIVFKYLDNLIAWADSLFTQNTIETINQATQLYIFASHLLGPRPETIPPQPAPAQLPPLTYGNMRANLDMLSDMVSEVESMLHSSPSYQKMSLPEPISYSSLNITHLPLIWSQVQVDGGSGNDNVPVVPLVFCVPPNTKLLTYFDTIDDRLFKIRNCMNIEGVVEQLPLFQPPIDPALLVRAAAAGLDISSVVADLGAPLPFHRFMTTVQKASELCAELKSLGGALLSALEKQDAETMAMLRSTQDVAVQTAVLLIKQQQVQEAQTNKTALQRSRDVTQARYTYYSTRPPLNPFEGAQLDLMAAGATFQMLGSLLAMNSAPPAYEFPVFEIGPTGMGVHGTAVVGGVNTGDASSSIGAGASAMGQFFNTGASAAGILGGYSRRQDEWTFQAGLATKELAQIDQQLAAADIRIAIANQEVKNQQLLIDNATKIQQTLQTKYTNTELYQWMVSQISTTYYQAYKVTYDLAQRAERCYRYELGLESSNFIQFGYWDSLRKGLLAGDQLAVDLKRLEASYLQLDRREYEITRQFSLVLIDPQAFMTLRTTGTCQLSLPEELFDADYPGHYFRRIKSVSLSLPCVAGPYTAINCTATLLASRVRIDSSSAGTYSELNPPNDPRFSHNYGAIQSVCTSHGQNDAGLFELSFRDERYLPFEGAGAISQWQIALPLDTNAFDFDTLSDAVLKISYTARDGGAPLAKAARTSLQNSRKSVTSGGSPSTATQTTPLRRMFRVRYEFSDAWIAFRNALAGGAATLSLTFDQDRFPYVLRGMNIAISGAQLFAVLTGPLSTPTLSGLTLTPPNGSATTLALSAIAAPGDTLVLTQAATPYAQPATLGAWIIAAPANAPAAQLRDLIVVLTYTATAAP